MRSEWIIAAWLAIGALNVVVARHFEAFDECRTNGSALVYSLWFLLAWPVYVVVLAVGALGVVGVGVPFATLSALGRWLRRSSVPPEGDATETRHG